MTMCVRLQGAKTKKVEDFKYSAQASWNGWRQMTGGTCDKRVSAGMRGKVYKMMMMMMMMESSNVIWFRDSGSEGTAGDRAGGS